MFSTKNKKQNRAVFLLALFFFSSGIFFLTTTEAQAGFWGFVTSPGDALAEGIGNIFKGLLYGIFLLVSFIASMAITLFEWAIKPEYVSGPSGLLNRESVYTMWKFIRDFFNLFFILTLLYTAFTIIFQVAKDYKKTLLSLVLAALFVNFSFPITRVIIDVTNVPMYYFVNQLAAGKDGKKTLGSVLSASQLREILIPGAGDDKDVTFSEITVTRLFMAIIFMFVFSITLLVLAIMFVVRLAALIVLLIFSSVGFAASVIPGMKDLADKWWKHLFNYAIFGPAAMLMLVVATRFFAEIASDNTKSQFIAAATENTASQISAGTVGSMAMFTIPIVMLWMAIGLAVSSSVIGAGAVVGMGYAAIKGAGRYSYKNPIARGFSAGAKEAAYKGKIGGFKYGETRYGKFLTGKYVKESGQNTEGKVKGLVYGGKEGKKTELQILHEKRVNEAVKERKDNKVTRSANISDLTSGDVVTRQSAAVALAEDGDIMTGELLDKVIQASADKDGSYDNDYSKDLVFKMVSKAKDGAVAGMSKETYAKVANNSAFYKKKADGKTIETNDRGEEILEDGLEALNDKLKKEGKLNIRVDYQVSNKGKTKEEVYAKLIKPLAAEDLVKQTDLHRDPDLEAYFMKELAGQSARIQKVLDKAVEKGKPEVQKVWMNISASGVGKKKDEGSNIEVVTERAPRSRTTFPS